MFQLRKVDKLLADLKQIGGRQFDIFKWVISELYSRKPVFDEFFLYLKSGNLSYLNFIQFLN